MISCKIILAFLQLAAIAYAYDIKPCPLENLKCFQSLMTRYLTKTAHGVPLKNLKQTDPMVIKTVSVNLNPAKTVSFKLSNVSVKGLSNLELQSFNIDLKNLSVAMVLKGSVRAESQVDTNIRGKKAAGEFGVNLDFVLSVSYLYENKVTGNRVNYVVKNEKVEKVSAKTSQLYLSDEFLNAIVEDAEMYKVFKDPMNKKYTSEGLGTSLTHAMGETLVANLKELLARVPADYLVDENTYTIMD